MVSHYILLLNITLNNIKEIKITLMEDKTKEIDLLKVAAHIYLRKKVIIISFIISICLGLIYTNSLIKERAIHLNIDILKSTELYEYSLINFLSSNINNLDKETLGLDFMIINSENLGLLAQSIFNDTSIKNEIINNSNLSDIIFNDDESNFRNFLRNFVLLEPILDKNSVSLTGRQLTPYYQLRLTTSLDLDDQDFKTFFSYTLKEIENLVKKRVNSIYSGNINKLSIRNKFALDKLINKKNNLIDDYIINRKARLLYLEENLAIAIAKEKDYNNVTAAPFLDNAKVNIYEGVRDPFPYYFYGSTAIMQEILEVKKDMNVINPSVAIEGVLSIDSEIRNINQNKDAAEIQIALNASPLGENNEFKLFSYNIDNLKYKNLGKSNYLIIFFFGIVGVFFGILSIFISYLKKQIENLS